MWPAVVCLAVVMIWFAPWWLGGKNLAPLDLSNRMMSPWSAAHEEHAAKNHIVSDGVDQYLVYRMVAERSYHEEGWVGWSSLTYGGTAQYANTMALYYDWTMQLHRWLGFWTAWHVGLMAQVLLAAWGMLLFLRGRSIGGLWACCGALAYAANTQFVTWIYHRWTLGAFCWVPWVLWAIDGHRRGWRLCRVLVPVFLGMAFLGGTLQHAALVVLAVVAMWVEEAWGLRSLRGQVGLLGRYAVWGILGMGLAGMMFLPCADAFVTSSRLGLHTGMYGNAENGVYPEGWLQPLFNLASYPLLIFPSLLGRCDSLDALKLFKSQLLYVAYFGSLPVLVALLGLWRKRTPMVARVMIGCGLLLPLTPLVRVLYQRLLVLFILGGVVAFAQFMEAASREIRLKVCRITGIVAALVVSCWTAMSVAMLCLPGVVAKLRAILLERAAGSSFGYYTDWVAGRTDRFTHDLMIWSTHQWVPLAMFAAALGGLRWTASLNDNWRRVGAWLVAVVVVGEVSWFGAGWVVWSDPASDPLFCRTAESAALQHEVGRGGRVSTLIHPTAHMACTPFVPNTLSAYGIATISGYDSIVPAGMILPNESAGDAAKLGRLGVSHLVTWSGNPDVSESWKPVWRSPMMALYQNSTVMPRYAGFRREKDRDAFFAGGEVYVVALVETGGKENRRLLRVPAGVRWVRIAENQDRGWEYRTEGAAGWKPVMRAMDASMLLEIPNGAGDTQVEMRYDPPLRRQGFWVSGIASAIIVVTGGWRFRPRFLNF